MKKERPFLDTMRWVLVGGLVGLILYLLHVPLAHEESVEVDNHAAFYGEGGR